MALTVDKLLGDARLLVTRLKDQDNNTDTIISTSQILNKRIEAMKQYQDDIHELNEMAKHRPRSTLVMGLAQENRQIRELQQEKQELQLCLEEHQSALQLIMHKYRQHTVNLLRANHRLEKDHCGGGGGGSGSDDGGGGGVPSPQQGRSKEEVCRLLDKVEEMAGVMQRAVRLDDRQANHTRELTARLELENRTLRQMLEVCTTAQHPILSSSGGGGGGGTNVGGCESGGGMAEDDEASLLDLCHFNASLDSSYSSQVSQIEVKPPSAEEGGDEEVVEEGEVGVVGGEEEEDRTSSASSSDGDGDGDGDGEGEKS